MSTICKFLKKLSVNRKGIQTLEMIALIVIFTSLAVAVGLGISSAVRSTTGRLISNIQCVDPNSSTNSICNQ